MKYFRIYSQREIWFTVLLTVIVSATASAQVTRAELVDSARSHPAVDAAVELYRSALNPELGERLDGIWGEAVIELAEMLLFDAQDADLAMVWLRWALRLHPEMGVNLDLLGDSTRILLAAAREYVGNDTVYAGPVSTSWRWERAIADNRGDLQLSMPSDLPGFLVRIVQVGGLEEVEHAAGTLRVSGASRPLLPGSYLLRASATGYVGVEVVREVVPGATTVVEFDLSPILAAGTDTSSDLPDSMMFDGVEATALRHLGRLQVTRYGAEQSCGAGVFIGSGGLFLTTYRAIRGAESLEIQLSEGTVITEGISVAAYDTAGAAVLRLPSSVGDSLTVGAGPDANDYVWAMGFPGCSNSGVSASRVTSLPGRRVRLADSLEIGDQGGPLIDQSGSVVGLTLGGHMALPVDAALVSLDEARGNIRAQRLMSLLAVAEAENHRYGAVSISSDLDGSVVRITPLETWHWSDAGGGGTLPLSFSGPMGRYRIRLLLGTQVRRTEEFTLNPAVTETLQLISRMAAEMPGETQAAVRTGGRFPWLPVGIVGALGAGVGGACLAGIICGEPLPPPTDEGWIAINLPASR